VYLRRNATLEKFDVTKKEGICAAIHLYFKISLFRFCSMQVEKKKLKTPA
jgi:hypothetical protein